MLRLPESRLAGLCSRMLSNVGMHNLYRLLGDVWVEVPELGIKARTSCVQERRNRASEIGEKVIVGEEGKMSRVDREKSGDI